MEEKTPNQLTLELPLEESIRLVHPNVYNVLQPNVLITGATAHFSLSQFKVFTEILSIDHKLEPNKHMYSFPYSKVYSPTKNPARNVNSLKKMFLGSSVKLPSEYANKVYGKNFGTEINLFTTMIYRSGHVDVEMHRDFKKLLVLTENHYTKGELELLKSFNSHYSHKLYWIVRMNQAFKSTMDYTLTDFRKIMGMDSNYSVPNITARALKPAKKELMGTWAEFNYSYIKENNKAVGVRLYFKSNKKLTEYIKADIRYEWEERLDKIGVDISTIMNYRKRIVEGQLIKEEVSSMKWNFFYIGITMQLVMLNNRVKHKAAYVVDSLEGGYYLKDVEERIDEIIKEEIELYPLGYKVREGVKVRRKVLNRSALVSMEDMESDVRTFEMGSDEYLKLTNRHLVTRGKEKYGVNCDIVPEEVDNIDDWQIIEDLE